MWQRCMPRDPRALILSLSLSLLHPRPPDFFISVINLKTGTILGATAVVYLFVFFFFSIWWYLIVR